MKVLIRSAICVWLLAAFPVLAQRASAIESKQPCVNIAELPFTITAPGRYCLSSDQSPDLARTVRRTAITIDASNVILDCKGHAIKNPGDPWNTTAIRTRAPRLNGLIIRNCTVQSFESGIMVKGNQLQVLNNTLHAMVYGIAALGHDIRIIGNRVLGAGSTTPNNFQENISVKSDRTTRSSKVVIMNNVIFNSQDNTSIIGLMTSSVDDVQIINNQILNMKPSYWGGQAWAIVVSGTGQRLVGNTVMVGDSNVAALVGTAQLCVGNVFIGAQTDLGDGETAGISRCESARENYEVP
jgi:hypothetical protein